MAAYFFASPIDIDVKLEGEELRKQVELKGDKDKTSSCPVYYDGDSVTGQVRISFNFCRKWGDLICRRWQFVCAMARNCNTRVSRSNLSVASVGSPFSAFSVQLTCSSELFYDRGHHHEFLSISQELAAPGEMRQAQTFEFNFKNVEKQYESYQGINVKLR